MIRQDYKDRYWWFWSLFGRRPMAVRKRNAIRQRSQP